MKIEELRQELETKKAEVRTLNEANKVDEAEKLMEEVRTLKKKIEMQEEIEADEKRDLEKQKETRKDDTKMEKVNEKRAFVKKVLGKEMNQEERAVVKTTDNNAVLPKQYIADLQTIREGFAPLKRYCHVIPVNKNEGSMPVFDATQNGKLKNIAEGDAIEDGTLVTTSITFKCSKVGIKVPLTSELVDDAEIEIESAVKDTFGESSVMTENYNIINVLNTNATLVEATDYTAIEDVMAKAVPSIRAGLMTFANVEAYADIKNKKDKQGRNMNLITTGVDGKEYYNGKEIVLFDSSFVTPSEGKTCIAFVVNAYEALKFFDRTNGTTVAKWHDYDNDQEKLSVLERVDIKAGITRSINKIEY